MEVVVLLGVEHVHAGCGHASVPREVRAGLGVGVDPSDALDAGLVPSDARVTASHADGDSACSAEQVEVVVGAQAQGSISHGMVAP